jgi:Tn3 transposase DDE domain-containing protein
LTQVAETWNFANGVLFYGKDAELTGSDREHQETSMLALHLLKSALVHVNTFFLQRVLADQAWGDRLAEPDRRAITPLFWNHVNPTGASSSTWTASSTLSFPPPPDPAYFAAGASSGGLGLSHRSRTPRTPAAPRPRPSHPPLHETSATRRPPSGGRSRPAAEYARVVRLRTSAIGQ